MDLTSIHTWWNNDDLLWDTVVSKHPARANLAQETGVMFYETADGRAWRTEAEVRDLFERKLALGVGVSGAGFINWIWNTNPMMASDNEAAIGLFRPDGTAKPEFDAWRAIARFARDAAPSMTGRQREDVVDGDPAREPVQRAHPRDRGDAAGGPGDAVSRPYAHGRRERVRYWRVARPPAARHPAVAAHLVAARVGIASGMGGAGQHAPRDRAVRRR